MESLPSEARILFQQWQESKEEFDKSNKDFERGFAEHLISTNKVTLEPNERIVFSYRFGMIGVAVTDDPEEASDGLPDQKEEFDPRKHDGACLIYGLISYLRKRVEDKNNDLAADIRTDTRVALGAYDYLTETIGLDIPDIFRRWEDIPITFMPAHISNKYGQTEKGSLYDLINDAVRAYVCGAPAAAIAMCRAALEMVLKEHYGKGEWSDPTFKLGEVIVLASQRFDFIQEGKLGKLTRNANEILHNYSKRNRMSEQDERTILEFLKTVKFLIQRAPSCP